MTKEELEEKIKNNESIWVVYIHCGYMEEINDYNNAKIGDNNDLVFSADCFYPLKYLFSTKAQAQHCLDNGNVTRTEKLPFVTWEEFKNGEDVKFKASEYNYTLLINKNEIILKWEELGAYGFLRKWEATEENFYKAYEIARKLFLGEEI